MEAPVFGDKVFAIQFVSLVRPRWLDYLYARNSLGQITKTSGIDIPTSVSTLINYDYLSASNRLIDENGNSYTYDNNGNITSDGINTFTYDQSNRLVEVQQNGVTIASYSYNSTNQRVVKTTGTSTVYYHYDTFGKLITEADGNGTPLRDYIYLNNEPLAVKIYRDIPGTYYFLNDHLGTPQKLVDSSGTVVWQAVYLHYGKALITVETISNNLRWPGQYYDGETGLHYNWHRYYDSTTGRYISADPIGLAGGINLYAYVSNDPVNFIDPTGEFLVSGTIIAVGVLLAMNSDIANAPAVGDATYTSNGAAGIVADGIIGGATGYVGGKVLGKLFTKCPTQELKYAPRVRARGVEDPVSHNFPYSFDKGILATKPIPKNNGYQMYQKPGTMNGKNGVFEIGVTKKGVINHRFFRPDR